MDTSSTAEYLPRQSGKKYDYADVAELVDAPGLSLGEFHSCKFDSCHPYHT